ncbi:MAG: fibronectin type III domain-containing protein, partial [Candidatus Hydrogenedentota bacterium]
GAAMDLIALATDENFEPAGPRPESQTPPPAVEALQTENARERVNRLEWAPSDDPGLSHYQVYASRQPIDAPAQEHLIGSPTRAEFIDWGLRAGTEYHYAVTAVDRRGNESEAVFAQASTPAREAEPVTFELPFAEGDREGDFEESGAGGLRGPAYLAPASPDMNRVEWDIEVPHAGEYYFWLRHLQRGSGGRGDNVWENVQVSLNGESLTTVGGGSTDLHVPDDLIEEDHPLAPRLWTWVWPGNYNLEGVELPAGKHTLAVENLNEEIRYDVLLITDEPSFQPEDGRLRQR